MYSELIDRNTKVSFRSRDSVDVSKIATDFGGGGHTRAAGCTLAMSIDEAQKIVIPAIRQMLMNRRLILDD